LAATVQQHRHRVTGLQLIRIGKCFAHKQLTATARVQPAAGAKEQPIQLRLAKIRKAITPCRSRVHPNP
jgi:hypothetical protein